MKRLFDASIKQTQLKMEQHRDKIGESNLAELKQK